MTKAFYFNHSYETHSGFKDNNISDNHDHLGHETVDKKLLVISHSYNNFQKDSIEGLSKYFKEINVIVRTNPFAEISNYVSLPQLKRFKKSYKIDLSNKPQNIHVMPVSLWYLPSDRSYKSLGEKHFKTVEKAIQNHHIAVDLVHSHFIWSAGYVGARLKEKIGIPFVVTGHGYDVYSLPFKDEEWREKIENVLNTADHIITVSKSNLACINKLNVSTPVTVIPNGFKGNLFYPQDSSKCRKILNLPLDKRIILTVGNLEPIKGQLYLVEAVHEIILQRKDVLCVIVGMGREKPVLEKEIHSLGLEDHIKLVGGKPHDEIPLWMNACDVFVLPSLRESFGVVQIEALACGKPVIATRNGGSEEIITSDKYGLLIEPTDPEELAKKILMGLDMEWNRDAILSYAERFTWEKISKEILQIYQRVGMQKER